MSLALPTNIAQRSDRLVVIQNILSALGDSAVCYISDGTCGSYELSEDEFQPFARKVSSSSVIYILDSSRGHLEPVVGFLTNQSLGRAHVQHVIDRRSGPQATGIPRQTVDMLGVYSRSLFAETDWLQAITVNADVTRLDGQFDLRVQADENCIITLADAIHRPHSSRVWA